MELFTPERSQPRDRAAQVTSARRCCDLAALAKVLSILERRWAGSIIAYLMAGPARFCEIAKAVPGLSERLLAVRLGEMAHWGLIERLPATERSGGYQYQLTEAARDLQPALRELERWALEHRA